MVIDVVDNRGVTSMAAELETCFRKFRVARLATASLTREGLIELQRALSTGGKSLTIKLLVGLFNGHTEAAALRRLLSLQKQAGGTLEVQIAKNSRFHWKVYIFSGHRRLVAYVGSSNLTGDGLATEGEFNLRISGTNRDRCLVNITDTFDRSWRKDTIPLDQKISESFASMSRRSIDLAKQIDPQIRRLLRRVPRPVRNGTTKSKNDTFCYTFVDEFTKDSTNREVRRKTRWESSGWNWMVFSSKAEHDRLIDAGSFYLGEIRRNGGSLSLNDVRDDDEFKTEDGRLFVAYQKRKGSIAKSLTSKTLKLLREGGLISRKGDLCRNRTLGKQNRLLLNKLLKVQPK
jgi:HKD family nuclease